MAHGIGTVLWLIVLAAAAAALIANFTGNRGHWFADGGAVATTTAYAWGLAARTGGRPAVFALLALVLGAVVVGVDSDGLRSGAAVVTTVLTAVFAVMVTAPAVKMVTTVREVLVALVIAVVGAMATLAWAPVVALDRFEYTALGLSLVASFLTVFRLGAGFHGLGTRGILAVVVGSVMLAVTLGYAELLRRYGTQSLVDTLDQAVRWSHHHLGAFPRPIIALLGVPALTWGTHMRARRRQGWWVCAFGVALTAPVAYGYVDPGRSVREVSLAMGYGVLIGLLLGFLLIRVDLALTGSRGSRGRRTAGAEEVEALRPEPGRTHALW
ncbi:MAG: hypothetical protein QOH37_3791 [Nocardioidaceae bacterium]|nr:hypothetical protein [Nocardioidaceae bacterium]